MFFRLLSRLVETLVILIAGIIVAIVTAEVTLRYLFSHSMIFTEELSRYLMVWIVFLGSALAIRDGSHIRIQILVNRLGPRLQQIVKLAAYALIIAFLIDLQIEEAKYAEQPPQQQGVPIGDWQARHRAMLDAQRYNQQIFDDTYNRKLESENRMDDLMRRATIPDLDGCSND